MSDHRRSPRRKKRMACRLTIGDGRHSGVVLDVSETGIFVQTTAKPRAGEVVEVELTLPDTGEAVVVKGKVARKRVVPRQLQAVAHGGIGVQLVDPPKQYLEFAAGAQVVMRGGGS